MPRIEFWRGARMFRKSLQCMLSGSDNIQRMHGVVDVTFHEIRGEDAQLLIIDTEHNGRTTIILNPPSEKRTPL